MFLHYVIAMAIACLAILVGIELAGRRPGRLAAEVFERPRAALPHDLGRDLRVRVRRDRAKSGESPLNL